MKSMPPQTLPPVPPVPPSQTPQNSNHESIFNQSQLTVIYIILGFFFLSSAVTLLSKLTAVRDLADFSVIWFGGVILGAASVIVSFVGGLFNIFKGKGPNLLFSSVVLALLVGLVGFGTCAYNLNTGSFL
jgi:hypothetical protein